MTGFTEQLLLIELWIIDNLIIEAITNFVLLHIVQLAYNFHQ